MRKLYPDWKSTRSLFRYGTTWFAVGMAVQILWVVTDIWWIAIVAFISLSHGLAFLSTQLYMRLRDQSRKDT